MPRQRKGPPQPFIPKTPAHAIFVRRVYEELDARGMKSENALKLYGIKQRTLWDALKKGTDVRLTTIYATARALGMETAELLRERESAAPHANNITPFPSPPPIPGRRDIRSSRNPHDRKKPPR